VEKEKTNAESSRYLHDDLQVSEKKKKQKEKDSEKSLSFRHYV